MDLPKRTRWQGHARNRFGFYCPNCKTPRELPFKPRVGTSRDYVAVGLASAAFTLALWPWLGLKGLVAFLPILFFYETYWRVRMRSVLPCGKCGFDPFLYLRDVSEARAAIERFWRAKLAEKGIPYPGDAEQESEIAAPPEANKPSEAASRLTQ